MTHLLTILLLLPVAGTLALVLYSFVSSRREEHYRWIAFITTVATFVASLLLLSRIGSGGEFTFEENVTWIGFIGARYHVAVDGISLWLVLLTTLLMPISVLSSWTAVRKRQLSYYAFLLILESALIGVFVSLDLLLFYLFFEASLIPMFFLIGVWGGERRIYAAVKFFIYTAVGSLLMLVAIIALLHVRPAVTRLLDRTRGNLFSANLLSRIGEMSQTTVARRANNAERMDTLAWDPDPRAFRYKLAAPFTAAGYDALVDLYERILVRRRAIPHALAEASTSASSTKLPQLQRAFSLTYRARPTMFEDALLEARDVIGSILARSWRRISPYDGYPEALSAMLAVARERYDVTTARIIRDAFAARGIAPGVSP